MIRKGWLVGLILVFGMGAGVSDAAAPAAAPAASPRFEAFDTELREAIAKQDTAALALLVEFPLRLNLPDGTVMSLVNPRALQTQLGLAFPPAVRKAILESRPTDMIHRASGTGYRGGVAWVELVGSDDSERYRLTTVNLPGQDAPSLAGAAPRLEFVCDAAKHRAIVDSAGDTPRYRVWNKPRSVTEEPDLEIRAGSRDFEGTTPCTHAIWTFRSGTAVYTVEELGCAEGDETGRAKGELIVKLAPDRELRWWCF